MARILVVDDDEFMRALLAMALEQAGHVVLLAANGRDAIRLFHEAPVQMVITDMVMPEVNGLQLIEHLRKARPELPIVAMSGGSIYSEPYLELARERGAAHVLSKPFGVVALIDVVNRLLQPAVNP